MSSHFSRAPKQTPTCTLYVHSSMLTTVICWKIQIIVPNVIVPNERTWGDGHKLEHRKFHLSMRKNFPVRVPEQWHRLPREAVESPSLETFKPRLDAFLCPLLLVSLLKQGGWTR